MSLPQTDIDLIDDCAAETGTSRSSVMHYAVELLREARLEDGYAAAWAEWEASGDAERRDRSAD